MILWSSVIQVAMPWQWTCIVKCNVALYDTFYDEEDSLTDDIKVFLWQTITTLLFCIPVTSQCVDGMRNMIPNL